MAHRYVRRGGNAQHAVRPRFSIGHQDERRDAEVRPYREAVRKNQEAICTLHRGVTRDLVDVLGPKATMASFVPHDPDEAGCLIEVAGVAGAPTVGKDAWPGQMSGGARTLGLRHPLRAPTPSPSFDHETHARVAAALQGSPQGSRCRSETPTRVRRHSSRGECRVPRLLANPRSTPLPHRGGDPAPCVCTVRRSLAPAGHAGPSRPSDHPDAGP